MTDREDYRLYLDERFAHLTTLMNANHKEAMDSSDRIDNHLAKLNGQVTETVKDISNLKIKNANHIIECPAMPKIEAIQNDLGEYRFAKNHPKLMVLIVAFFAVGIIISMIGTFKQLSDSVLMKEVIQQTETTNQILVPTAIQRGFDIDSLGLND